MTVLSPGTERAPVSGQQIPIGLLKDKVKTSFDGKCWTLEWEPLTKMCETPSGFCLRKKVKINTVFAFYFVSKKNRGVCVCVCG